MNRAALAAPDAPTKSKMNPIDFVTLTSCRASVHHRLPAGVCNPMTGKRINSNRFSYERDTSKEGHYDMHATFQKFS